MDHNDPLAVLNLYDKPSEEILLAAVLKDDRLAEQIIPRVQMAMFSDLVRQYIYGAAADLHRHGHAVTVDGVIAKSRELAGKAKLRKRDFVTRQQVERLLTVNIEGADVIARATTVADIWSLRTYADSIGRLVDMIAQRPDPKEFRGELMALLSSVSQGKAAQEDGIHYGFDASDRMNEMLDRFETGRFVRWSWPWRALDFVAPLPPGFCALWGMIDGSGKSSLAESLSRHNAECGHTVVYIATEYEQEVLDARILQQVSGIPMQIILAGGYTKDTRRRLDKAREYYAEKYPTLHYISASGLNMSQIVGKLHTLKVHPDITVWDYLQDVAFDREDRGDATARGNNAMRLFHAALKDIGSAGFVVSQLTKVGHTVHHPNELSRALLNAGNPAIAKSQCTGIAYRNVLEADNSDLTWDKNGVPLSLDRGSGRRGEQSKIIQFKIEKQTLGRSGFGFLGFTDNQNVVDLPPRVVEHLGGRVTVRDPGPGEKTLMADGY